MIFGAGSGFLLGMSLFASGWTLLGMTLVVALIFAFSCHRWGERAWGWAIKHFPYSN